MKTFWLIAALIVIAGSVWFLTSYYAGQPETGTSVAYSAPVACTSCEKVYITMLTKPPVKCAFCGEQTVWRALQCADCGAIIPMVTGKSNVGSSNVCTKCGGSHLKEVSPDGLEKR